MSHPLRSAVLGLLSAIAFPVSAGDAPAGASASASVEASIPFANRGGISDWRVEDDSNLLLQDNRGQWYRARLQAPSY